MEKVKIYIRGFIRNSLILRYMFAVVLVTIATVRAANKQDTQAKPLNTKFAGSVSCRQCHERFYELWSTSHHGLAMQPYTASFANKHLTPQENPIRIGQKNYRFEIENDKGWIFENDSSSEKKYPLLHVMGGKNVYYFLTPMEKGRLQTLPLAFDVQKKEWFDTAASGVRHFPGHGASGQIDWKDPLYTFNTSCYGCHVSQLTTNYDLETDSYNTVWAEPGINCEACHGSGIEHVRVCLEAQEAKVPEDLKIIRTGDFTPEQMNSMCNTCHAKQSPISVSFKPGDRYFDHFDLITLEHHDYYPDGRDLGENYTMTTWRMNPCVKGGNLDCMHCHTSSGRYRFKNTNNPNAVCLPCHRERVENVAAHTHHEKDSEGSKCISCHMPITMFARMRRSDHSMRPPTPAASLKFKSPNACNVCHNDKDVVWADQQVRQWHKEDYQKPFLERGSLLDAARRGDWRRLDDILTYIGSKGSEEVYTASLIRSLLGCESNKKWPVIIKALASDPSPLVRAASAQVFDGYLTSESLPALLNATNDEYRLVRVRAAAALAGIPVERLRDDYQAQVKRATTELIASLRAIPDDYTSHYNMGNFRMDRRQYEEALASYKTAIKLRPDFMPPYVNIAFVYNAQGQNDNAVASLRKAIALDPNNSVVHLNLGMLLGEMGQVTQAEKAFRAAYKIDPNSAVAAYNLGIILSSHDPKESLAWCEMAYKLKPEDGRYGYTYAFYLHRDGSTENAVNVLEDMTKRQIPYADAYSLLGAIYIRSAEPEKAAEVYRNARDNKKLSRQERKIFEQMLKSMGQER